MKQRFAQDYPGKSDTDYVEWRQSFDRDSEWSRTHNVRCSALSGFWVICLSMAERNHLMWSHYAHNHQGFCIGFDETRFSSVPGFIASGPVQYHTNLPRCDFFASTQEDLAIALFFHKSSEWSYEQEYRVVLDRGAEISIGKDAITEVLLGCRAFFELRSHANANMEISSYPYFQMIEEHDLYSLKKAKIDKDKWSMSSIF